MRFFSTLIASALGTLVAVGVLFFLLILFILAISLSVDPSPDVPLGSVLVIDLGGGIAETTSDDPFVRMLMGATPRSMNRLRANLRKAASDDRIEGLWIRLEGSSSSWATLGEIREALLTFKESGKPVYASTENFYIDEADYYLASVADSIFAGPESLFEFNGFYITAEFYKPLLDRLEIEPQVVRAGEFKSAVEPFLREDLSPENREQLELLLGDWNAVFMRSIAEARGMRQADLQEITNGVALLSASEARARGLLDGLLYREQIIEIWKARLALDPEEDLQLVDERSYTRVTAASAGVQQGDEGEIAVVYADGTIVSGESRLDPNPIFGGAVVGSTTFGEAMREARESERVKAVVVRINSPGGVTPAADEMWHATRLTAEVKPVLVSMGDYAASGGYWIATAADSIIANPLTLTGSIGVFSLLFDASGLFEEKIGIRFDHVRTAPHADMLSGLRALSPPEREALQRSVDEVYASFIEKVADARGMSRTLADSLGRGRVWTGVQAERLGLVDQLGSLPHTVRLAAARAGMAEGTYRLRILPRPPGWFELFSERLSSYAASMAWRFVSTPTERAAIDHVRRFQGLVDLHGRVQVRLPTRLHVK